MTYFRQPWGRLTVTGRRCRLQVLDPNTAFEIEPELIDRFGNHLALALAAPRQVLGVMWSGIVGDEGYGSSFADAVQSSENRLSIAVAGLSRMSAMLTTCMREARLDGPWMVSLFERFVFDRLRVGEVLVEDWATWSATGLGAEARWRLIAAQLEQTFRPLWLRSPYTVSRRSPDFGVPLPQSVPKATQWADALVKMGHAPSSIEIMTSWTPVQLMDVVDLAALHAEIEHRAMEAARSDR